MLDLMSRESDIVFDTLKAEYGEIGESGLIEGLREACMRSHYSDEFPFDDASVLSCNLEACKELWEETGLTPSEMDTFNILCQRFYL